MFCYTAHYRSPLSFSFEGAASAEQGLANLRKIISSLDKSDDTDICADRVSQSLEPFMAALCDDLNMPRAMAALWEGLRSDGLTGREKRALAEEADKVLGLGLLASAESDRTEITEEIDGYKIFLSVNGELSPSLKAAVIEKIVQRKKSRAAKDFKTADQIRDQFAAAGIAVKDLPGGAVECAVGDPGAAEKAF
jgi:cysteinyl-tRNA synthetase